MPEITVTVGSSVGLHARPASLFVQAAAKYVKIYAAGRCYSFRQSLGQLEQRLDAACFVRVHRSTLVNVEHIAEMHPLFHGDYELILRRGTRLTLSRRYRERLAPFLLDA